MLPHAPHRPAYSRAERVSDAAVHLTALVAALGAVPVLITLAAVWRGDVPAIVGTSIYGGTLIAMISCSLLYNAGLWPEWHDVLNRLDHSAIYFKIAGTYTPFTLLSGTGFGLMTGLWGAALAGTMLKVFAPGRFRWLGFALYLGMGWAGLVVGWELFSALSPAVLSLLVAGGLTYTVGTVFYLANQRLFHNTIWHVFVMSASAVLFVAVMLHLSNTAPAAP